MGIKEALRCEAKGCETACKHDRPRDLQGRIKKLDIIPPVTKTCNVCGIEKPRDAFRKINREDRPDWDYRAYDCKDCSSLRKRADRYGISIDEIKQKFIAQRGCCAVCGKELSLIASSNNQESFHLDHDHFALHARGLLCGMCNIGIGSFQDNPVILRKAALYLEAYRRIGPTGPGQMHSSYQPAPDEDGVIRLPVAKQQISHDLVRPDQDDTVEEYIDNYNVDELDNDE